MAGWQTDELGSIARIAYFSREARNLDFIYVENFQLLILVNNSMFKKT